MCQTPPYRVTSEPNLAIIMEGSTADYAVSENCDLAAVGNLNERNYALAFNRGKLPHIPTKFKFKFK